MSLIIERVIICDACLSNNCHGEFGVDSRNSRQMTAKKIRKEAKKNGWKRVNGEDICPKCFKFIGKK